MKVLNLIIIGLVCSNLSFAQVSLTPKETETLKEICENYYKSLKDGNLKQLRKSSPERFHGFIEQLTATKSKNKTVLEKQYLTKPTYEELVFWYVIREIHYNRSEEDKTKKKEVDDIIMRF